MSRAIEKRDVEVIRCDFCGDETQHSEKCILCGKEGCGKDGGKAHFAFAVEGIYHYDVEFWGVNSKICKECAARKLKIGDEEISVGDFLKRLSPLPCIN